MAEERVTILRMVSEGKLSPEQAEELLDALGLNEETPKPAGAAKWGPDPEEEAGEGWGDDWSGMRSVLDEVLPVIKREVKDAMRTIRVSTRGSGPWRRGRRVRRTYRTHTRRGGERLASAPSVEQLVELHNHGIDAEFVRKLRVHGLQDLSMDDVVELSDHGVTPDVVGAFHSAGLEELSAEDLIELVDHGVEPGLAHGLRGIGFIAFGAEDLIALTDHGVDIEFITGLHDAGLKNVAIDEIIELADNGMDPDTVKKYKRIWKTPDSETSDA